VKIQVQLDTDTGSITIHPLDPPAEPVATDRTAGYLQCSLCWVVYDVAPGDPMWCPDCGPRPEAATSAAT
jgi:hypothetical protein